MKKNELDSWLQSNNVKMVRTEGTTLDGLSMGKHLSPGKFTRSLPLGPAISDYVFAADLGGRANFELLGRWSSGFLGDIHQRPDLSTLTMLPGRPGVATCITDHVDVNGTPIPVDPRVVLRGLQEQLAQRGYQARLAFEIEAMIFAESFGEARAKGYHDLRGAGMPIPVVYLNHNAHQHAPFMETVAARLDAYGIDWEAWNDEMSPGQIELNLAPDDPLTAADSAQRTRQVFREVACDMGHAMTFMAKPTTGIGNGLHIHHSLLANGQSAFHDANDPKGRSEVMRHWLGGLMATMDGAVSLLTPTVNAYRRMVDYVGAPTTRTWGEENKSAALRLVSRNPATARIEHRIGAGDLNPYVAAAAIVAGGLVGLDAGLEPPEETHAVSWGTDDPSIALPNTITKAADALAADEPLTRMLGPEFVDHWLETRPWEQKAFSKFTADADAATITDWELNRYFELV